MRSYRQTETDSNTTYDVNANQSAVQMLQASAQMGSFAQQSEALKPARPIQFSGAKDKTVNPSKLPIGMVMGSTSETKMQNSTARNLGFEPNTAYTFVLDLNWLMEVGESSSIPANMLATASKEKCSGDLLEVNGEAGTHHNFNLTAIQTPDGRRCPGSVTVRASNNGLLSLLRAANATPAVYSAVCGAEGPGMRMTVDLELGRAVDAEDARVSDGFGAVLPKSARSRVHGTLKALVAAAMAKAGMGSSISSSYEDMQNFKHASPSEVGGVLGAHLNSLWASASDEALYLTPSFDGEALASAFSAKDHDYSAVPADAVSAALQMQQKLIPRMVDLGALPAAADETFRRRFRAEITMAYRAAFQGYRSIIRSHHNALIKTPEEQTRSRKSTPTVEDNQDHAEGKAGR